MLESLHIENIAVIKKTDADFKNGFTVFTGETGAGKSIIIDSINLLFGGKFQRDLIRTGETKALVSAVFSEIPEQFLSELEEFGIFPDDDRTIIVERSVSIDSKSSFRINGRTVSVSLAREIGNILLNVHGQNENIALQSSSNHIKYLDRFAGIEEEKAEYKKVYSEMRLVGKELEEYVLKDKESARKKDLLEYQINEIESSELSENEEEELLAEKKLLQNSKKLSKQLTTVYRALYKNQKGASASQLIEIASKSLDEVSEYFEESALLSDKLSEIQSIIEDIAKEAISVLPENAEDPEARLEEIEERLDIIRRMKRKYGPSLKEVFEFYENSKKELDEINSCSEKITEYEIKYGKLYKKASEMAMAISDKRKKASSALKDEICACLEYLDMEKASFSSRVEMKQKDENGIGLDENGCDCVSFYVSTNTGEPEKPLSDIASGGEISRIMLAIKCAFAKTRSFPTMIFDEIDTGVSGKTSQKIGLKLRELGKSAQVLCVTHSSQVASVADYHYLIKKYEEGGRTYSSLKLLSKEERIAELSRIIGGVNITEKVIETAREMLASFE